MPGLKYSISATLITILFIIILFSGFAPNITAANSSDPSAITFKEFLDDYNTTSNLFESWDPGKEVVIEDTINYVQYDSDADHTYIFVDSVGTSSIHPYYFDFIGKHDVTYQADDEIQVMVTIMGNSTYEYYHYTLDNISYVEDPERIEEHGVDIFWTHFDLPEDLDNDVGRFLLTLLSWLIIGIITLFVLDPVVRAIVKKSETQLDDIILSIIRKPVLILIILYGLIDSLNELHLPDEVMDYFLLIYGVAFILMMTWIAIKIFKGVLIELGRSWAKKTESKLEHVLIPVIEKLGSIIIVIFGLIYLLSYFGIDVGMFVVGMGVMGLVIAFAAQDTLSNFFGGIFLIVEPNFKEGDIVKVKDDYYQVKTIGMRTTRLYDIFKHLIVVVPNNILANEMLINLTEPDRRIKDRVEVGVAYGTDTDKVEKLLLEIGSKHPDIINDDPNCKPFVRFLSFGDSSLNFALFFWVKDLDDRYRVKHELNHTIHREFEKADIEIPFPQRVVTMKNEP
ncbi:MAG: mechanosensitive ion channel [Thermoplasmata archaeon]|nr:MAG: mechanosensitive ion channel [Thermoplasmata archaeon]